MNNARLNSKIHFVVVQKVLLYIKAYAGWVREINRERAGVNLSPASPNSIGRELFFVNKNIPYPNIQKLNPNIRYIEMEFLSSLFARL